jgi:dipeptidyl aminopeptidase/acylaminoacyl peptidase
MTQIRTSPYGTWKSPITAERLTAHSIKFGSVVPAEDATYWTEMRPEEGGRNVIVRRDAKGDIQDITPKPYNVRTTVHEYGGGPFTPYGDAVFFVNYKDQRLYKQGLGNEPTPITSNAEMRYADLVVDVERNRLICVREDHTGTGEAVNGLAAVDLNNESTGSLLVSGNDFYASPRLSPDDRRLAWITWNHPNMPWDGTELWVADILDDGSLDNAQIVAGGEEESIFQPEWSPDGELYFVSDAGGWWNIHRLRDGKDESVLTMEAEFGMPQWVFGMSTYIFVSSSLIVCAYNQRGFWHLAKLNIDTRQLEEVEQPYNAVFGLWGQREKITFIGASPTEPRTLVELNGRSFETQLIRRSSEGVEEEGYLSVPEVIEFPTSEDRTAFAYFYAPQNSDYELPTEELPPLVVMSHGGPTGSTTAALDLGRQFWTSRGVAVLDVNYGGSTGYGREYRMRLNGNWGIVDVDDCVNAAKHLVERGLVDGGRLAIRGASAGGFTTFAALAFRDFFHVGASYFGVSDMEILAKETHKFESRYTDILVGPYPEAVDLLRERSPLYHVDKLSSPMILFQGLEDRIVLPNQSEMMADALRKKGIPVAYIPFEGEQHGFRQAKNIIRSLEAELYFYGKVFSFEPADQIEPVTIDNI